MIIIIMVMVMVIVILVVVVAVRTAYRMHQYVFYTVSTVQTSDFKVLRLLSHPKAVSTAISILSIIYVSYKLSDHFPKQNEYVF